ncbi:hypothetical protein P3X46_018885 [Hevea brasiliensis]|uniref:Protein kinase domain-containing protein n=1 Tax=Hevea brasiliensis TaxID=3981 RepID=A0ABQ9LW31_HEVBR|nr:lysM domain receptor-like kinase 4 [Hevea brasiliensis]KAJ9170811.1 hypothetical protein P3X46_018885 [Hevea brasiliensis]
MDMFLLSFLIVLFFETQNLYAQQNYSGNLVMDCHSSDSTGPSPAFLYSCNGKKQSCKTFLIYKSQPPYNTVSSIANLTSSDPLELSRINNISRITVLPTDKEVLIPVICSCSGQYYQANTSYTVSSIDDTYFTIANNTYEGLSTCNSLMRENNYSEFSLDVGMKLRVPLRCACPTSNQTANGTQYLLTYLVSWGDEVPAVGKRFNANIERVIYANGFSKDDLTLFPFTTILVPLSTEPSTSQTIIHHPPPPDYHPVIPNHQIRNSRKGFHVWIILGVSLLFLLFVLFMVFFLLKKKIDLGRKDKGRKKKSALPEDFLNRVAGVDLGLKIYAFEELKVATEDFSTSNRLSGSVYRGIIGGQVLAIKKTSRDISNEVNLLRKINHFNLISLYAACEHHGVFYLMYEFMESGSLRDWLYKRSCPEVQNWNRRIQIALDVASGLHYLHNFTDPPYVHKDISSSNVLLSRHFRAKIANFSLARAAEAEEHVNSSLRLALGSKGYMAPEYTEFGLVTPKIDTYAFGVILLELVTGKEAVFMQDEREMQLSETIILVMEKEDAQARLCCLVDPILRSRCSMEVVLRMVRLSLACLQQEPESRPSMAEIVSSLSKIQLDVHRSESVLVRYV